MSKTLPLILFLAACTPLPPSDAAGCRGVADAADALNTSLLADGGPQSLVAGANLLSLLDAWCGG